MPRYSILVALVAAVMAFPAFAADEMPTDAQKKALRADCRDDFLAHCKGVEPGGKDALVCLADNQANLSDACVAALEPVEAETGIQPETGSGG